MTRIRLVSLYLLVALLGISLPGCSALKRGAPAEEKPALALHLSLGHTAAEAFTAEATSPTAVVFRPGAAVYCAVEIRNLTNKPLNLLLPYARQQKIDSNTNFYLRASGGSDVFRRAPIFSKKDVRHDSVTVAPNESTKRILVFTVLTRQRGTFLLQADYVTSVFPADSSRNRVISPFVGFRVEGERLWQRDLDGVLAKEDAIKLAKARYGKPVNAADARLVENEAGFLDWWVTLEKMPADTVGGGAKVAYLVNPYGAFVRQTIPVVPSQPAKSQEKAPKASSAPAPSGK